jgi:predicted transcriptional regulator of viral defense system
MKKSATKDRVLKLARRKGHIKAADLQEQGLPREYLSRLAQEGLLVSETRGVYQLPGQTRSTGAHDSLVTVARQVPRGVIALLSALRFHELGTQNPFEVWIAVENKSWIPKIEYPSVRFVYFSTAALTAGVERHVIDGVTVPVFNVAKTVADCFKYRNKIGLDVAMEALREGWRDRRFTMDELHEYADICRVGNVMRPYMEALV